MLRNLVCVLMLVSIDGCVYCQIKIKNATDGTIRIKTTHTREPVVIRAGNSKAFGHASGDLLVESNGKTLKFEDVGVCGKSPPYSHGGFVFNWRCAHFLIDKNLQIYALHPGEKTVNLKIAQPQGYPKVGIEQ